MAALDTLNSLLHLKSSTCVVALGLMLGRWSDILGTDGLHGVQVAPLFQVTTDLVIRGSGSTSEITKSSQVQGTRWYKLTTGLLFKGT